MIQNNLQYRDSDGGIREVPGVMITQDKNSKYWVWSELLQHNLAYKIQTKEEALLSSIASLLYTVELKNKRIEELQQVYDLAMKLADKIKPDCEDLD